MPPRFVPRASAGFGRFLFSILLLGPFADLAGEVGTNDTFLLHSRDRRPGEVGSAGVRVREQRLRWEPEKTAVVVCDMWDRHWCLGATERVAAMAPRVNAFLQAARERGALIIHCPSGTMDFYAGTPQRELAQSAPPVATDVPIEGWCHLKSDREAPLPIDDSDGGCDDRPRCKESQAWTRQIATLEIAEGDAISDSAEVLYLMAERGIENVMLVGVHLNMCVLGRPFGIRQLVLQGKQVVLVRDLTDTMYNSARRPAVSHFTGTDLMVEHVERYWCPTITSSDLLPGAPSRFPKDVRPRVVAMLGEDEYRTWETVPTWAGEVLLPAGCAVAIVHERADERGQFPGLERELPEADLLFVSVRRRALPPAQLRAVRRHLEQGKPLVAIRTASHAFAPRGAAGAQVEEGTRAAWADFDPEVLGGNYHGHHGEGPMTRLSRAPGALGHPVLTGVDPQSFVGHGSLYRAGPLVPTATPLLMGSIPGQPAEPVAWTHRYGAAGAKVFYTSLGQIDDFAEPGFSQLLLNAVNWGLGRPPASR